MQIEKDAVVTFFYQLSEEGGEALENNENAIPMAYLHGHGNILAGLETELEGLEAGTTKTITLPPEKAYGQYADNAEQRIPIKHIASKHKRLLPGTLVKVQTENGHKDGKVVKAGKFMVNIDFNHPFAGKTLVFNVTIDSIREASADELSHGHAHGAGGHHH